MYNLEKGGKPCGLVKWQVLAREIYVFAWRAEKAGSCPVPSESVFVGQVPVGGKTLEVSVSRDVLCSSEPVMGGATEKCKGTLKYSRHVVILYAIPSWVASGIFFLQPSASWLGGGKFIRLEFLNIVSFPARVSSGWMSYRGPPPCLICLVWKLLVFIRPPGELRGVRWWSVCQFIFLCSLGVWTKSQQFQWGTAFFVSEFWLSSAPEKKVAVGSVPG